MTTASLWFQTAGGSTTPRSLLPGDLDVDVAIVGAGYTGLWTAYYLRQAEPSLRIAIIEAEQAGFGASGRNGGWCSGLLPVSLPKLSRRHGRAAAIAFQQAMNATVDEVGRVVTAEGIDCYWRKGGSLTLARSPRQLAAARAHVAQDAAYGFELELLDAAEAQARCGATAVHGATYTPHCAAVHPLRLARGLAEAVERLGVPIYEGTRAVEISEGRVRTALGTLRTEVVVRATEGYTPALPGYRRTLVPLYSLMIATEPLPAAFWAEAGLAQRETFSDHRKLLIYGQRTADDRLAFGGRGAPYHFGSAVRPEFDVEPRVHAALRHTLVELFPQLADVTVTHAWGGPLALHRDWHPSVGLDPATGLAWAGGYVGDGVAASNLAGRTLADLITKQATELTALPWVNHRSRQWEPEPLRWLGINAGLRSVVALDALARLRPGSKPASSV